MERTEWKQTTQMKSWLIIWRDVSQKSYEKPYVCESISIINHKLKSNFITYEYILVKANIFIEKVRFVVVKMQTYKLLEKIQISYGMRENSIDIPHSIKTKVTYDLVQHLKYI